MTNTIQLKRLLTFQEYQLAVKALAGVGIEVKEPEINLLEDEIKEINEGIEDLKNGRLVSSEQMFSKIKEKYGF